MKRFLLVIFAVIAVFTSCSKQRRQIIYTYYVGGNEVVTNEQGDTTASKGIIYRDDVKKYSLTSDLENFTLVNDVTATSTSVYACGAACNYSDNEKYPVLWENGAEVTHDLKGKQGVFTKCIALSDGIYTIGTCENKGVMMLNSKKVFEYGEEGRIIEFKAFAFSYRIFNIIFESWNEDRTEQRIKVFAVAYDAEKKEFVYGKETLKEYDNDVWDYDQYTYDVKDLTVVNDYGSLVVCAGMNRYDAEGNCSAVYSYTHSIARTVSSKNNSYFCSMSALGNEMYIAGSEFNTEENREKAYLWRVIGGEHSGKIDCSKGLEGDCKTVIFASDGVNTHMVMHCPGMMQYQIGSLIMDVKVAQNFTPNSLGLQIDFSDFD